MKKALQGQFVFLSRKISEDFSTPSEPASPSKAERGAKDKLVYQDVNEVSKESYLFDDVRLYEILYLPK